MVPTQNAAPAADLGSAKESEKPSKPPGQTEKGEGKPGHRWQGEAETASCSRSRQSGRGGGCEYRMINSEIELEDPAQMKLNH